MSDTNCMKCGNEFVNGKTIVISGKSYGGGSHRYCNDKACYGKERSDDIVAVYNAARPEDLKCQCTTLKRKNATANCTECAGTGYIG